MKKIFLTLVFSFLIFVSNAQIKMHSNGQVSFQSTILYGGVQINPIGMTSFEPNITQSYSNLNRTKAKNFYVKAWVVEYDGQPSLSPSDRFYVTGEGDAYANNHYTISPGSGGGGTTKGIYPIENAAGLLSNLNGYFYDNDGPDGFKPDFINNPNVAPEAIEGLMKDLEISKSLGLSAEELEVTLPEAVRHDPEGMVYINYSAIIPVLVEAIKEQQQTIEQLQLEIADIKNNEKGYRGLENSESTRNALYQNAPNPTHSSTTIECYIDTYVSKAFITVYDLNGLQLKEYPISRQGRNNITIEANELKPGIYFYSLLVDDKLIDTKRMVITSK